MNKKHILAEAMAIFFIILSVLLIKVTILEAYIVPTGSMENTIMTGDFLIGSRFVYGMRTPDWLGIPYTDIGFFIPYYKFPGLKEGDKWCLCVNRWIEAEKAGKAPKLILEATHEKTLEYTKLDLLVKYAFLKNN